MKKLTTFNVIIIKTYTAQHVVDMDGPLSPVQIYSHSTKFKDILNFSLENLHYWPPESYMNHEEQKQIYRGCIR